MNARSVVVKLRADIADYKQGMAQAGQASHEFVQKNKGAFRDLSSGFGMLGLALTGFAFDAVRRFANFDAAMSNVQAATQASASEMKGLRDAALDAGMTTAFSATKAAGGIEELGKAGISTSDILGGALAGTLDLAAAGELSVADAATYASIAMTQFGLKGRDVGHIADLLAAGANKALGGVSDLGEALKNGGLSASQAGMSIEETTGTLAAFAQAGLIGADAGTALKSMLMRLNAPTGRAKQLMDELGVSAYDASGEFVGMANFAGQLESALEDKSTAERNSAMSTIFGSYAVRAASIVYEEGADGIQGWIDAVNDQGYAAMIAATKLDNLKGDLGALGGAYDVAMIKMGEGSNGLLRSMTQGLTDIVRKFGELPPVAQSATLAIVGGGGLALLGMAGLARLTVATAETIAAMQTLGIVSTATATRMKAVAASTTRFIRSAAPIAGIAVAIHLVTSALDDTAVSAEKITNKLVAISSEGADVSTIFDGIKRSWYEWDPMGMSPYKTPQDEQDWKDILQNLDDMDEGFGKAQAQLGGFLGMGGQAGEFGKALEEAGKALSSMADVDLANAQTQFAKFVEAAGGGEKVTRQLLDQMPEYEAKLYDLANAQGVTADDTNILSLATGELQLAQGALGDSAKEAADSALAQSDAYQEWIATLSEVFASFIELGTAYDGAIEANKAYAESVAAATATSDDSWEDYYDGVAVSAEDYIAQLQSQVAAQEAWAANMTELTSRLNTTMSGDMRDAANAMIEELTDLGPEGAAQVQLLHDMTDAQLSEVVTLYGRKGDSSAAAFAEGITANQPEPIQLHADPEDAVGSLNELLAVVDSSTGTVTIEGEDTPVIADLAGVTAEIDEATGTVTIYGDDGAAVTTLSGYTTSINASTGAVTITGTDTKGRQATATLTTWISQQGAPVLVSANTDPAMSAIERFRQTVARTTVTIQAQVNANPNIGLLPNGAAIARAAGGPIFGPGTATSDSIPARLSVGEHVWSAREVAGMGGHGMVAKLRAMARQGYRPPLAFADGGAVAATQSYQSPVAVARSWTIPVAPPVDLTGLELTGTLLVNGLEAQMTAVATRTVRTSQARRPR